MKRVIRLFGCYPLTLEVSGAHWHPEGTHHGPRSMPALAAATYVRLGQADPEARETEVISGRRLWLYFRRGYAIFFDAWVDRSEPGGNR